MSISSKRKSIGFFSCKVTRVLSNFFNGHFLKHDEKLQLQKNGL